MTGDLANGLCSQDFEDLCRLCGSKTSVLLGLHIFEREGNARQIFIKIKECLPVRVEQSDKLPKMICEECVYKLDLLFEFREKSVKTECFLQNLLVKCSESVTVPLQLPSISLQQALQLPTPSQTPTEEELCLLNAPESEMLPPMETQQCTQCEPEIFIKEEEINLNFRGGREREREVACGSCDDDGGGAGNKDETESDSESASDSDSDPGTGQKDDVPIDDLTPSISGDDCIKASTSQISVSSCVTEVPSTSGNTASNLIHLPSNDVLMLSCSQSADAQVSGSLFFCNVCGKTFSKREEFQLHYETHCSKCTTCGALFTNEDALNNHQVEVHPVKLEKKDSETNNKVGSGSKRKKWEPKVCTECGKQYRTNYKLSEHMRKHTGEKPFKCSMCPKAFRSKIGLAQHEAKHTGQFDYTCNTCGKGFQCKSYLIVHQRVHSDLKPYPCATCGRNFKTKQSLLDHQNRHLGVKPYLCETCGRRFITKGLCKSHQRVHSGTDNKQFPCTVCNKMFVSKSYLTTHARIHTGEKPFMCEVCGKGFLTRVDLRIHSTMHTGEKSFICEWCGKAFARRDALRCHRRSHTGERPYRCDICGQTFTQFSPLTIHKRLHTGERPYMCDFCPKTFVSRSTMMSHRKKHHSCNSDMDPLAPSTILGT